MLPLLPAFLGVLGAFAYRRATATNPGASGQLHSVEVSVPSDYVAALRVQGDANGQRAGQKLVLQDIGDRLATMGWQKPLLVTQDPTEPSRFTALTRVGGPPTRQDDVVTITGAEPVTEPSYLDSVAGRPLSRDVRLDPGLTDLEVRTVRAALRVDDNPSHLDGFAASFEPFFPVTAGVLRAAAAHPELRGKILTLSGEGTPDLGAVAKAKQDLETYAAESGLPLGLVRDDVRRAASVMLDGPADDPSRAVAVERVPGVILAAARAIVRGLDVGNGDSVVLVDPKAVRALMPGSESEAYVSPTAAALVVAGAKPKWAGVKHSERVALRFASLKTGDNVADLLAASSLERAERAVERRRWLEWYRRVLGGAAV